MRDGVEQTFPEVPPPNYFFLPHQTREHGELLPVLALANPRPEVARTGVKGGKRVITVSYRGPTPTPSRRLILKISKI
jgi:hypothetical protein